MNRTILLRGVCCLVLFLGSIGLAGEGEPAMAILHTNDVHGRFAVSDEAIGHDRIAALFEETRRKIPATLLLDAGDAVQGSGLVKWNKGKAAIEIMNAAGYDAMALGNHEFDYGWDELTALAALAEFPFLTQTVVSEGAPGFEAAALFERGGRRMGVFGLTTPETRQASGGGVGRYFGETEELLAYAGAMAAALRRSGAEVVVCLAHLGVDDQGFLTSYELRDRVGGIDVIVDGHSHTPLAEIVQAEGRALIVSTGEHAEAVGLVEFHCIGGRLVPLARSLAKEEVNRLEPNPVTEAIVARWVTAAGERGSTVLTRSPVFLDASRANVRTRETELGNLLADAVRSATGCDVAVVNGGNIRAPLPEGNVTIADIDAMLPYDSTIQTAKVRGGAIRDALELSVSRYPGEFGGFLQVSGVVFAFDPDRPTGSRVTTVEIGGRPLEDDQLYEMATCDWLASGGDGYEMLIEPFKNPSGDEVVALADMFIRYLDGRGADEAPTIEGRIVPDGKQ